LTTGLILIAAALAGEYYLSMEEYFEAHARSPCVSRPAADAYVLRSIAASPAEYLVESSVRGAKAVPARYSFQEDWQQGIAAGLLEHGLAANLPHSGLVVVDDSNAPCWTDFGTRDRATADPDHDPALLWRAYFDVASSPRIPVLLHYLRDGSPMQVRAASQFWTPIGKGSVWWNEFGEAAASTLMRLAGRLESTSEKRLLDILDDGGQAIEYQRSGDLPRLLVSDSHVKVVLVSRFGFAPAWWTLAARVALRYLAPGPAQASTGCNFLRNAGFVIDCPNRGEPAPEAVARAQVQVAAASRGPELVREVSVLLRDREPGAWVRLDELADVMLASADLRPGALALHWWPEAAALMLPDPFPPRWWEKLARRLGLQTGAEKPLISPRSCRALGAVGFPLGCASTPERPATPDDVATVRRHLEANTWPTWEEQP